MGKWGNRLGIILVAIWLILTSLAELTALAIPAILLQLLALAAGILLILEGRVAASRNLGRILLGIWLILMGLLPLLSINFPSQALILAVLALAAGVLLLIGR